MMEGGREAASAVRGRTTSLHTGAGGVARGEWRGARSGEEQLVRQLRPDHSS
eukprot:SAG31_NODE_28633_length_407_cov_0.850649_1_plen_51_part_10